MPAVEARVPGRPLEKNRSAKLDQANRLLKDAEVMDVQADAWLHEVARRVSSGEFGIADCEYLRGIMGSERFEEGSVAFLDTVLKNSEEIIERGGLDPEQLAITQVGVATAKTHLRALGKRLAGLRLMLDGPKPVQPAADQLTPEA